MKNIAVTSCIFGKAFDTVYPAPRKGKSFFFSNRKDLLSEANNKGWRFIFVDFPLSDDDAISSLQSKYIKFLQFLSEKKFEKFHDFDQIVHVDHKFYLKGSHLKYFQKNKKSPILLRKTPRLKTTVWDEVDAAMQQERYRRYMPQTQEYINSKINAGYTETIRICNTGLIAYSHNNLEVIKFVDEIYSDLMKIGTSECQIIWALVSQKYLSIIQVVEWSDIPIVWETPS